MRQSKNLLAVLTIIVTSCFFYSCSIEDDNSLNSQIALMQNDESTHVGAEVRFERDDVTNEGKIILGKKRNNPFKVSNINLAKALVYGQSVPNKVASHKYIKFKPSTMEHLDILEDWDTYGKVSIFDFPLEYEIVTEGESYIDPSVSDYIYTYQYTSIPVGTQIPNVPYEIIDELYIDKSDPLLLAESFWLTDNAGEINEYVFDGGLSTSKVGSYDDDVKVALSIPPVPDEPCPEGYEWVLVIDDSQPGSVGRPIYIWECSPVTPPPPPPTNDCGCPIPGNNRNPAGCVRVDGDFGMVPVEIASIEVKDSWFTSDKTYTDANGCWRINKNYSGQVWMWVRFKNENVKVRDVGYWESLRAVRDYAGRFDDPPYNNINIAYDDGAADNTSPARRYWAAAHTLNTVNQYRNRATVDDVPLPRTDLNWTNAAGDGGAAAPMLQWNPYNSWPAFLIVKNFPVIYSLTLPHLPDIINQYGFDPFGNIETAAGFNGTGFHELGHATHHSLVGEAYWFDYRNHIINNVGYGSFGNFAIGSDPGRVALGEAIGNFVGAIYGNTADGGEGNQWDTRDNFIPQGLMWDLRDDEVDFVVDPNNPAIGGQDNISGFTTEMIFNGLTPNVNDIRSYRDRLRTLHLGDTPNNAIDFNNFVDIYDVFN